MDSDWSVACGADDPVVVVPWRNRDGSLRYIDLRATPERLGEIPEAAEHASLGLALRRWNQADSSLFTAKCNVWDYTADLFDAEDLDGFSHARGSYVDLISTDTEVFSSFSAGEQLLHCWSDAARVIPREDGRCEWMLRPARMVARDSKYVEGFATCLYVWGYGSAAEAAETAWAAALLALVQPVVEGMAGLSKNW